MKFTLKLALPVVLSLTIGSSFLFGIQPCSLAQTPQEQTPKAPAGAISGRVTIQSKGAPGIVVGLRCNNIDSQRELVLKASTDDNGHYRIDGVPPGSCVAAPVAPNFVVTDYSFNSPGKTVVVSKGETVEDMDFAILPGGVITGKVTDADGHPLIEEQITLLPADPSSQGGQTAFPNVPRDSLTDDRGIYRIFGLAAGKYQVAAGLSPNSGQVTAIRRPYQQTFYPDTTNLSKARVVEIAAGPEVANIDIVVGRTMPTYSASGRMVDGATGQPILNRRWGLAQTTGGVNFASTRYPVNSRGEFSIDGLLPGRYAVFLQPEPEADGFSEPVPFEIVDKDVDGLVIKTSTGASLAGRVVIEGADKTLLAKLSQMRLNVYMESPATVFPNWFSASINADGSFRLGGLQRGTANINTVSAEDPGLVKDLLILQTERDGQEQPQGIALKEGEQVTGLTVVIARGTGVISGELKYVNGSPPFGMHVQLRMTRTDKLAPLTATDVDARGRFRFERLPPGSYWLDSYAYLPFGSWRPPPSIHQQLNIATGSVNEITVTLDLSSVQAPSQKP